MIHTMHPIPYSRGARYIRVGNNVYFSGLVALDEKGKLVGAADFEAQCRRIFQTLERTLASLGGGLAQLVNLKIYLTHQSYMETYRKLRLETFPENPPTDIVAIVSSLADPGFLVEIDPIAVLD